MFFDKEDQKKIFKEIFPYSYYNKTRYLNNIGDVDEAMKAIFENTREEFIKNGESLIDDNHFDMQKYSLYYCNQDVIVLSKSVLKFRQMLKDEFELELFNYVSISSLSIAYQ